MKKLFAIFIIALIIVLGLSLSPSIAKNDKDSDIPEQDGIYDVSGHSKMKVRVFVHKTKPSPNPQPSLVCGLSDYDSSSIVGATGWKLPSSFSYYLNSSSVPSSVNGQNLLEIAGKSFKAWTDVANTIVNNVGTTTINRKGLDGKNIIAWGSASGSALAVTYIWYYPSSGKVVEIDTIMNKNFFWMWSDPDTWGVYPTCAYINSYDAQNILTHELGHWFGLKDYYTGDYAENTMYGYGSKTETKKNTLTTGDIEGVRAIY